MNTETKAIAQESTRLTWGLAGDQPLLRPWVDDGRWLLTMHAHANKVTCLFQAQIMPDLHRRLLLLAKWKTTDQWKFLFPGRRVQQWNRLPRRLSDLCPCRHSWCSWIKPWSRITGSSTFGGGLEPHDVTFNPCFFSVTNLLKFLKCCFL